MILLWALAALPLWAAEPWTTLWTPRTESVKPGSEQVFEEKPYATYATRHFVLYYPATRAARETDRMSPLHTAARLDGLFDFLASRLGTQPKTPVRAILISGEYGHSRALPDENAIRTGEKAEFPFMLGSLFHELVHLFNFSVPGGKQDFWSGELYAQYHADRLLSLGLEHKARYRKMLSLNPKGFDWAWIRQLDEGFHRLPESEREKLMEVGISVHYFLEDEFGAEKSACFWKAHLDDARRQERGLWESCFGKSERELRKAWLRYYGL